MNVNLSGDFDLQSLKKYADEMKDRIEALNEITRVDIVGAAGTRRSRSTWTNIKWMRRRSALKISPTPSQGETITISGGLVCYGRTKTYP